MFSFSLLLLFLLSSFSKAETNSSVSNYTSDYCVVNNCTCGEDFESAPTYATGDTGLICLIFPSLKKKVVFNPVVDRFEGLQIEGLFSVFNNVTEAAVIAGSNGIFSRPAIFKLQNYTTSLMNLVAIMIDGRVVSLTWSNTCFIFDCPISLCLDTSVTFNNETYSEQNCFQESCSSGKTECDTKVYLTWLGTDKDGIPCVSDNYRISYFTQYSITSLVQSAIEMGNSTYNSVVNDE
mmetsp:Transcript_29468/g.21922  ORF Transcript_29468/g.21922 Transcript_29468/m.21922 type:complete len:236 (+) Transcript_29468:6-713(+)